MKKLLAALLALVMVLSLVACGSKESAASPSQDATSDNARDKHLIVAVDPDYETFDPSRAYESYADLVLHSCYDTLLQYEGGDTEKLVLGAAESYTISDDGLEYTFKIKPGQYFSSGNEVKASDFKWTIERGMHIQGNASFMTDSIDTVEAPDDYTLVLKLKEPDAALLVKMTYALFGAIEQATAEANGATNGEDAATTDSAKTWFDYNSAGSGPYKIESYSPNSSVVLVRNEYYSGTAPYYDKITINTVKDTSSQVMMVQGGDIDIAVNVDADQAASVEGKDGITVNYRQTATTFFLIMNRSEEYGPISNPKVQQAVRYALDYEGILMLAGKGSGVPIGPFPEGFAGSLPMAKDPNSLRDVEKAKKLMAEAGYADGFDVDFYVPTLNTVGVDFVTVAQKIQMDLQEIGVRTNILAQDVAVAQETYRNGQQSLGLRHWGPDYPDNGSQLAFLPGHNVGLRANWTAEMCPELADLAHQAEIESDEDARNALFNDIALKMNEESPFVFVLQAATQYITRDSVVNAEYSNRYLLDFRTISGK